MYSVHALNSRTVSLKFKTDRKCRDSPERGVGKWSFLVPRDRAYRYLIKFEMGTPLSGDAERMCANKYKQFRRLRQIYEARICSTGNGRIGV